MKIGRLFPDLLATLGRAASSEAGFTRTLKQLVALSGARAGGLRFRPGDGAPVDVIVGARRGSALERWIQERLERPARGVRVEKLAEAPPGLRPRDTALLSAALGDPARPVGGLVLLGPGGARGLGRETIPPSFPREFGHALEHVWRLRQRTIRLEVINQVMALTATILPLERVYEKTAEAVSRLIRFDALGVTLLDRERGDFRFLPVAAHNAPPEVLAFRMPTAGTLTAWVASQRAPRRVDDATTDPSIPAVSRELLSRRGFRSAVLAPLLSQGEVIGTLNVTHREPHAFTDTDVEILMEVARPLASAVEHARLHAESARRAEELAALNRTSQLITARLDLPSVLETISRSVTSLMGEHRLRHRAPEPRPDPDRARGGPRLPHSGVAEPLGPGRGGDHRPRGLVGPGGALRRPPRGPALRAAGPGREGRDPLDAERAAPGRRPDHRRHLRLLHRGARLRGPAADPAGELRGSGRHRDPERAPLRGDPAARPGDPGPAARGPRGQPEPRRERDRAAHPPPGPRGAGGAVVRPVHAGRGHRRAERHRQSRPARRGPARDPAAGGRGHHRGGGQGAPARADRGPLPGSPGAVSAGGAALDAGRAADRGRADDRRPHRAPHRRPPLQRRGGVAGVRVRGPGGHGPRARAPVQLGPHLLRAPGGDGGGAHPRARRAEALRGGGAGDAAPGPLRPRRGAARDQHEPGGRGAGAGGGRRAPALRGADAARQGGRGARRSSRAR